MVYKGEINEVLSLIEIDKDNCHFLKKAPKTALNIFWNTEEETILNVDGVDQVLKPNEIIFLTEFHKVLNVQIGKGRLVQFNRPFYCISTHDNEVSCKGLLFFGASQVPIIKIPTEQIEKFELLWQVFQMEMEEPDNLQSEMLRMLLKRFIILCTRLFKSQNDLSAPQSDMDIIREFNFLVESHFKNKHKVSDYAELLHKSPKTLSNLFAKYHSQTPLQIIKSRKMIDARRRLVHSNESVSGIAFDLGYEDVQSFSRFFKSQEGLSPKDFRDQKSAREKMTTH